MIPFDKDGLEIQNAIYDGSLADIRADYEREAMDEFGRRLLLKEPKRFIHYFYPFSDLQDKVYMRTSLIGKHRKTKEGEHLLDDIALTKDEQETFDMLIKDASEEVFEKIIAYTDDRKRSLLFNDGENNTIERLESNGKSVETTNITTERHTDKTLLTITAIRVGKEEDLIHLLRNYATFKNAYPNQNYINNSIENLANEPAEFVIKTEYIDQITALCAVGGCSFDNSEYETTGFEGVVSITTTPALVSGESVEFVISGEYNVTNFMGEIEKRDFTQTYRYTPATHGQTSYSARFVYKPPLDNNETNLPAIQPEAYIGVVSCECVSARVIYTTPAPIAKGYWIDYTKLDGTKKVYYSLSDSDMNTPIENTVLYVDMTDTDMRYGVHYIVNKPMWVRENSISKTDKSIEEALIAYVIYKWFALVFPSEVEFYLSEYEKRLIDVKFNLGFCERMSVTPHPF